MENFIANNYSEFAASVEGHLGCQGLCTSCPHPEYATADEQVPVCWDAVSEQYSRDMRVA